jgi:glycosyltransferase involved in cell wall biosynthesis
MSAGAPAPSRPLVSVVIPARNEQAVLPELHRRLLAVFAGMDVDRELVFVNDGSTDATLEVLQALRASDPTLAIVDLSRGFGKELALTAGLDHASGDAVVVLDADLQDPPELIPEFVKHWREGFDVVYGVRTHRDGETALKRLTAFLFYRVIHRMSRVPIPRDTGDFRLLSRRAVDALRSLPEQHRFMKGLFAWIGFRQKALPYRRDPRGAGVTKFNYWKLWNFAIEGITSFSTAPLRFATYVGLAVALCALLYAGVIVFKTLVYGNPVPGYPSLVTIVLFLGGVQLITIGVLGEYIGRIFEQVKQRPLYLVRRFDPPARDLSTASEPSRRAAGAAARPA